MKKYIYSLLAVSICLLLSWSSGFNFDERGATLTSTLYITIAVGIFTYAFTAISEEI